MLANPAQIKREPETPDGFPSITEIYTRMSAINGREPRLLSTAFGPQ